ncbi:tetratricopeptide repeat protein [Paenibacillus sp. D51F]
MELNLADRLQEAVSLRAGGDAEKARLLLAKLAAAHPEDAQVWYQLAWTHDSLGLESEAVPLYEKALSLGLPAEDDAGARLGLGSTLRTLGRYEESEKLLREAAAKYPQRREFNVFLAMTLHNLGLHAEAMELLLVQLAETSSDDGISSYGRALSFYSDKLDQVWN